MFHTLRRAATLIAKARKRPLKFMSNGRRHMVSRDDTESGSRM